MTIFDDNDAASRSEGGTYFSESKDWSSGVLDALSALKTSLSERLTMIAECIPSDDETDEDTDILLSCKPVKRRRILIDDSDEEVVLFLLPNL